MFFIKPNYANSNILGHNQVISLHTVCLPWTNNFLYFHFFCLKWYVIERYVWKLSTVQRWASNSQYWQSYGTLSFRRRALKTKIGKKWTSWFWVIIFCLAHARRSLLDFLQGSLLIEVFLSPEKWLKMVHQNRAKNCLIWRRPFPSHIWPNALWVGSLRSNKTYTWPYEA